MLIGLEGGASRARGPSLKALLDGYHEERAAALNQEQEQGLEMFLEILGAFFQPENLELIPGSRRQARRAGHHDGSLADLPGRILLPGLRICGQLFPYYCVVSSALVLLFHREVTSLGVWLEARLPGTERAGLSLRRALRRTAAAYHDHFRLQQELELAAIPLAGVLDEGGVQGRFQVYGSDSRQLVVGIPGSPNRFQMRLPAPVRGLFKAGDEVSMVLAGRKMGWTPLASSLPAGSARLNRMRAALRAAAVRAERRFRAVDAGEGGR